MNNMNSPLPAVKALINNNDRYLLLEQSTSNGSIWTLPGGKIEFGETPRAALQREVEEEVGFSITVGSPIDIYDFQYDSVHVVATVFECSPENQNIMVDTSSNPADETIIGHEWVSNFQPGERVMNEGLSRVFQSV
jgi:mutator protein MutT